MYEKTDATSFALDSQPRVRRFDFSADSLAALVCLTQLAFWTVAPSLVSKVPPMDALEGFMWGRQTVLLTYKHPQLPAWLMEIAYKLTGSYIWGGFLLSQVLICATFGFVYVLGRDLIGGRAALAGVLLLPTTGFYNWGARQVNHDIVQLPFWAAICWLLWRAERENKLGWWLALGVVAGAGLYAKFSTGLLIGFGGLWLLISPKARRCLATPRPWIALVVVLAFALPLMVGMYRMNFIQLTYASARDAWVMANRSHFYYIGVQVALLVVFLLALWSTGLLRRAKDEPANFSSVLLVDPHARFFLLWMGLGPALSICLISLFTGIGEAWGKPMYSLIGLVAIALLGRRLTDQVLRRLMLWGFGMIVFTALAFAVWIPGGCYVLGHLRNECVPGPEIAAKLQDDWHAKEHIPLGVVAGEEGLMMTVGVFASDKPSMFTEFNALYAPWITEERLRKQGMLIVWGGETPAPAEWSGWTQNRKIEHAQFAWAKGRPQLMVSYVMIPPGSSNLPKLNTLVTAKSLTR